MARIEGGRARMIDRGDDKTGVGEGLGGVVMAYKVAAPAVRNDDERQLVAMDRAVPYPGDRDIAEVDLARRLRAGVLDRSVEGWSVRIGGRLDEAEPRGVRRRRGKPESDRDADLASVGEGGR